MKTILQTLLFSALSLIFLTTGSAQDSYTESAVREASAAFVELFSEQDSEALAKFYRFDAALKLPNSASFIGRKAIEQAWAGGFANGLGKVALNITHLEDLGWDKVVESGTYELELLSPDGQVAAVQKGTYSVMWQFTCRWSRKGWVYCSPKILFDTIDANESDQ